MRTIPWLFMNTFKLAHFLGTPMGFKISGGKG